jgi:hypothetical protein
LKGRDAVVSGAKNKLQDKPGNLRSDKGVAKHMKKIHEPVENASTAPHTGGRRQAKAPAKARSVWDRRRQQNKLCVHCPCK